MATRGGRRITRAVLAANFGLALLFIFLDVFDVFSIYRTGGVSFFSRIVNIFNDNSAYGRLVAPFKLLQDAISINLFGIPLTELRTFFRIDSSTYISGLDNGLMNLFIAFGLTAVIIIFLLVRSLRRDPLLVLYFFLVAMFNGAIFSFDKTVMIGVVIILSGVRLRKAVDHEH
ncbi:hypothetical protein [Candidatus Villigracilis saccharophilus]|uniref:hypothetical protein n=1 Tax=Candidatus Villigracilis saccharophilus TaxID=3140684 RepID=UPI003136BD20|nr:hypothetical protein [Anaerolineales bacterium]